MSIRRIGFLVLTLFFLAQPLFSQLSVQEGWMHLDTLYSQNQGEDCNLRYIDIKVTDDHFIAYNSAIAASDLRRFRGSDLLAHLVNAYNFSALKNVVNYYPVTSAANIPGFYDKNKTILNRDKFTLNQLRDELIMPTFKDPRILFLLSDGTFESLPYQPQAIRPRDIDQQLTERTKQALNDTLFVKVDSANNQLVLAPIFEKYDSLFSEDGNILYFINQYRERPVTFGYEIVYRDRNLNLRDASQKLEECWIINLQSLTPALTLGKNRWAFSTGIDFYTQTSEFDYLLRLASARMTQLDWKTNMSFGLTDNIDVGISVQTRNVLSGGARGQNPVFVLYSPNDAFYRAAINRIGLTAKYRPFPNQINASVQTTFYMPLSKDLEGYVRTDEKAGLFVDWDRYLWTNDLRWDIATSLKWKLLIHVGLWTSIPRTSERKNVFFETPITATMVYFPNGKISVYGLGQVHGFHTRDHVISGVNFNRFDFFNEFLVNVGLGSTLQLKPSKLELDLRYSARIAGSNGLGAGNTITVGIRRIGMF